jgi:hypothetical protein
LAPRACLEPALGPVLQKLLDLVLANSGAPKPSGQAMLPEWECTAGASAPLVQALPAVELPGAETPKAAVVVEAAPPVIDISGTWRDPSRTPSIQITTSEQAVAIKYQSGLRFTGSRTGPATVRIKFDDDGCCDGKVSAEAIKWSNGTAWTRRSRPAGLQHVEPQHHCCRETFAEGGICFAQVGPVFPSRRCKRRIEG